MKRALVAIVGPTGSGKSDLAVRVAGAMGGEIVSCDALQVYESLDIGTAKTPPRERHGVPHHLVDIVKPTEEFSAADYIARATPVIRDIVERGSLPLVVGGTGLYLRALRRGLFAGPGRSPEIRDRLRRFAERRGTAALHRLLRRLDPGSAERVHRNDRVRLVRALEVCLLTGRPMSSLMSERQSPLSDFQVILVGLAPERSLLAERIERRVSVMFERGLVEEVRALRAAHGGRVPAFKAIGYREVLALLSGEIDEERAKELIALSTVQYAKRQMTWFRREEGIVWFAGFGGDRSVSDAVLKHLEQEPRLRGPARSSEALHAETAP